MRGNVLVTGGSGTLGHAIVRQAEIDGWNTSFTIYSRSELAQARMRQRYPHLRYVIGDVRDYNRLSAAIAGHDIVIHAAAIKRIPEAENAPYEAWMTNVIGSSNVTQACLAAGVVRCVGISTDKACRAITAYGATKLLMEKHFQAQTSRPTTFTLVRYGNVVASNGSVIPLWRDAERESRSVKVTDVRATRFWMDEEKAVELIQTALEQPEGTILVPKMHKLNLVDMAKLLVPAAHLVEVGMRSCEKLHEDLVHEDEIALDLGQYFLIGRGGLGSHYRSDEAPTLDSTTFLRWVREAEERDAHYQSVR